MTTGPLGTRQKMWLAHPAIPMSESFNRDNASS